MRPLAPGACVCPLTQRRLAALALRSWVGEGLGAAEPATNSSRDACQFLRGFDYKRAPDCLSDTQGAAAPQRAVLSAAALVKHEDLRTCECPIPEKHTATRLAARG